MTENGKDAESRDRCTYFEADNHVDLAHLLVTVESFGVRGELRVESVGDDEADDDQHIAEQHDLGVLHPVSGSPADQVVASLIDKPVQDAEAEEDRQPKHLVDIEGVPQHNGQEQELEDLLLALLEDVLLLDDPDVSKEDPDE